MLCAQQSLSHNTEATILLRDVKEQQEYVWAQAQLVAHQPFVISRPSWLYPDEVDYLWIMAS